MRVIGINGESLGQAVSGRLHQILSKLPVGEHMQDSMLQTVRTHFSSMYPGSSHWSPSKVQPGRKSQLEAEVEIDVPGVSRAYHDVTILPKTRQYLKIPLHRDAYGVDDSKLFVVTTKSGSKFLAENNGGSLAFVHLLCKRAFQPQDSSLMPSDGRLAANIFGRISLLLQKAK